jgi:hypothetical protein
MILQCGFKHVSKKQLYSDVYQLVVMKNLTIIQRWDTLQYSPICGNGYWPQICKFKLKDFVYL